MLQSPEETKPKQVVFRGWKSQVAESLQYKQCESYPKGPERMTKPISSTKSYLRLSTGNYLSKILTTPLDFHVVSVNNMSYFEFFFNISSGNVLKLCGISWSLPVYQNLFSFLLLRKCWLSTDILENSGFSCMRVKIVPGHHRKQQKMKETCYKAFPFSLYSHFLFPPSQHIHLHRLFLKVLKDNLLMIKVHNVNYDL